MLYVFPSFYLTAEKIFKSNVEDALLFILDIFDYIFDNNHENMPIQTYKGLNRYYLSLPSNHFLVQKLVQFIQDSECSIERKSCCYAIFYYLFISDDQQMMSTIYETAIKSMEQLVLTTPCIFYWSFYDH